MPARMIHQDASHYLRGNSEEVCAILPGDSFLTDQPKERLVYQRRRLQCVVETLLSQIRGGLPLQLTIDQRHQVIAGPKITAGPSVEQLADGAFLTAHTTQFTPALRVTSQRVPTWRNAQIKRGDDVQALAPMLVFALALSPPAQVSDEKDRTRRETLDAALVLASPHGAGVPIVLASIPPDSASEGVEAWTVFREDGKGDRVVVYTESSVFICASRDTPVYVNPYICLLELASIIVHEAWHIKNGPDEAGAYQAQLRFLEVRGGGSAAEIAEGVRRARERVKARTK
jgi:hypothetical protein